MKLNLKYAEGEWVKFKDAKVKIKMFPNSKMMLMNQAEPTGEDLFLLFGETVVDWKGFVDEKDKEIKCNTKNKKLIFDSYIELVNFVIEEQSKLRDKFEKSLKN